MLKQLKCVYVLQSHNGKGRTMKKSKSAGAQSEVITGPKRNLGSGVEIYLIWKLSEYSTLHLGVQEPMPQLRGTIKTLLNKRNLSGRWGPER